MHGGGTYDYGLWTTVLINVEEGEEERTGAGNNGTFRENEDKVAAS